MKRQYEQTGDEFYDRKMFHLGIVHDIGYQFSDNTKVHVSKRRGVRILGRSV